MKRSRIVEDILRSRNHEDETTDSGWGSRFDRNTPGKDLIGSPESLDVNDQYLKFIRSCSEIGFATAGELFRHWTHDQ